MKFKIIYVINFINKLIIYVFIYMLYSQCYIIFFIKINYIVLVHYKLLTRKHTKINTKLPFQKIIIENSRCDILMVNRNSLKLSHTSIFEFINLLIRFQSSQNLYLQDHRYFVGLAFKRSNAAFSRHSL